MKFQEIFRLEFVYQVRLIRTWLYFAILFVVACLLARTASGGAVLVNSPYAIAQDTVLTCLLWVLMAPCVAGSAAARDVPTPPLIHAAPVSKADFLGGRFLAAFALNALILLAVPLGILTALLLPGMKPGFVGPLRPAVYLSSYGILALPTAFSFTAVQFSLAALKGRAIVSYLGSVLFFTVSIAAALLVNVLQMPTLGKLLDPVCRLTVLNLMEETLTPFQMNTVLIGLESSILANRLLWIGVAFAILAFTYVRFRFSHRAE